MPFVVRDSQGRIVEIHASMTDAAQEEVAPDDPALRDVLGLSEDGARHGNGVQGALEASDQELIRVLEDLIAALIDKRIIVLTDLPKAAREKLAHRYRLRSRLADLQGIVAEAEDILLP